MFEEYLEKQKEKEREIGNDLDEKPESAQGNKRTCAYCAVPRRAGGNGGRDAACVLLWLCCRACTVAYRNELYHDVQCAMCSVQCAMCSVRCAVLAQRGLFKI